MARGMGPPAFKWYTPRQLNRQAGRIARQSIKASQAPIISAQKLADARAAAARQAMQGFGLAGASILKDAAPLAGQAYQQAAQAQASLAQGFSGDVAQRVRNTVGQEQALVDKFAPGGQVAAPNVQGMQNALYAGTGYIPGVSNEGMAASQIATSALQPSIQEGRTTEAMRGSEISQAADDQQYTQQMLDLAAKQPELRTQILQQLQQNELAKRNAWLQQQAQASLIGSRQASINQGNRRLNMEERQGNARIALQAAGLRLQQARDRQSVRQALVQGHRIDSSASHAAGYLIDRNGNPILNGRGQRIPVQSGAGGAGGGAKTGPGSTSWKEAYRYAQSNYIQPDIMGTNTPDPTWKATPYPRMVRYLIGSYGLSRGQARRLLRGMGIKPNTKRG